MGEIKHFNDRTRPKALKNKEIKETTLNTSNNVYAREMVLNGFKSGIFLIKSTGSSLTDHSKLKVLTPKQMLQRLPIVLAQVKAGNNSENLLNEIRQIIYSLYQTKEINENVYKNLMKKLQKCIRYLWTQIIANHQSNIF